MTLTFHRKLLSPAEMLFRQYKLTRAQRAEMIIRGLAVSQLAIPVGSTAYFIASQTSWDYPKKHFTFFYLGDTWDRLPVHVQNLLSARWFLGPEAPQWWFTARHDARHVMIGFIAIILASMVTVGLKERKRASGLYMAASIPLAFLTAAAVAAPLIWLDTKTAQFGLSTSNPYLADLAGKTSLKLVIIGALAGFAAKLVLHRTMDTIQLISLEKKLTVKDEPAWWWKIVYPATYRNRYAYLRATSHIPEKHGKLMGMLMVQAVPVFAFMLGFGIWLLYLGGPATGAH